MSWVPAPGAMLGGKYRLERSLAAGGMGSVWVARHERLDAWVAVKLMGGEVGQNPGSVARFEREAKACAQLQSAHVVTVHDFGVEDGTPYMVMELLRGEDLGDRIDRVGRMSLAEAAQIAVPIGKALRVAHEAGIIHRDLKPRNIFIVQQGDDEVVKLVDFGIARETKTKLVDDRTATGIVMGSPYHMSPEQAQALSVDHRTDLWALGVVLYRLVTGFRPFDGESLTSILVTICTTPHPPPSEVGTDFSPEVDAFFARALAKDPARRFQTARELVDAFLHAADARSLATSGTSPAAAPPPPASWPSSSQPVHEAESQPVASGHAPAPAGPPVHEASASHALRAVSTAAQPAHRSQSGVVLGVLGAVAAFAVVGYFVVDATRGSRVPSLEQLSSSAPAPAAASSIHVAREHPSAAATDVVVAPPPPGESAAPSPSTSPSPSSSVAVAPAAAPASAAPAPPPLGRGNVAQPARGTRPAGRSGPALDPFTGLPAK